MEYEGKKRRNDMNDKNMRLGIQEVPRADQWLLFSLQHLCAMFGATVLVPFLIDMSLRRRFYQVDLEHSLSYSLQKGKYLHT